MTTEKQAIKVLAEGLLKAVKVMTDENNKNYVDNKIRTNNDYIINSGVVSTRAYGGMIGVSQVDGLFNYIMNSVSDSVENADPSASRLITSINGLAQIVVQNAVIDTAQINHLYASYGEFIDLVAQKAQIQEVDVEQIYADLADIGIANIGSADIGYAQIKDLTAGTAIIREGIGGRLFIDRLSVSDANMVSLTTGELVIKGNDGKFKRIVVNQDGTVGSEDITFSGSGMVSGSLNGAAITNNTINAGKIIESSITARELNVSSIFADSALIGAIKAGNIDVADLFANQAYITNLQTAVVSADLSGNTQISLLDNLIKLVVDDEETSTQSELVLTDDMLQAISDQVQVIADTIEFSANTSIQAIVVDEVTNDQALIQVMDNRIVSAVKNDSQVSAAIQDAGKINWIVANNSTASSITLTQSALDAIADEIDLTANNTVRITSANQISATAANGIDLSSNSTVISTADNAVTARIQDKSILLSVIGSDEFEDLSGNVSDLKSGVNVNKTEIEVLQDAVSTKVEADDLALAMRVDVNGVAIGRNDSDFEANVKPEGFEVEYYDGGREANTPRTVWQATGYGERTMSITLDINTNAQSPVVMIGTATGGFAWV